MDKLIRNGIKSLVLLFELTILFLCFLAFISSARASVSPFNLSKLNVEILTGSTALGVKGSIMTPIWFQARKLVYGVFQTSYDTDAKSYLLEFGSGYRQPVRIVLGSYFDENMIAGGYLLADKTVAKQSKDRTYWQATLGGELYNRNLSISLNGYFSLGKHKWLDYSNSQYISFGINYYAIYDVASTWGMDLQVGHRIPILRGAFSKSSGMMGYVGCYHYDLPKGKDLKTDKKINSVDGISLKLSYELNKYFTFNLADTYDNYKHNTIMLGLRFSVGGSKGSDDLLKPLKNNIGGIRTLGTAQELGVVKV